MSGSLGIVASNDTFVKLTLEIAKAEKKGEKKKEEKEICLTRANNAVVHEFPIIATDGIFGGGIFSVRRKHRRAEIRARLRLMSRLA